MKKITGVVVGGGLRSQIYVEMMKKTQLPFDIVAVAEPSPVRTGWFVDEWNIKEENCFTDWKDLLDKPKMADFAIIGTQDNMHLEPALAAIEKGYHLLLEKPIAPTAKECKMVYEAATRKNVKVVVCHVLRYTTLYGKIKELITSGVIGDVMSVDWIENVGMRHFSHSYCRGNWGNTKKSSPMILAKCSHDTDLIQWLVGKKCLKVQSFGSLQYFKKENKPAGAPERCHEGCPHAEKCMFDTQKLYIAEENFGRMWFKQALTGKINPTHEDIMTSLNETQYGKCVFSCDNDVVDHQITNILFEGGVTANLTMTAFTKECAGRECKIMGTEGMIEVFGDNKEICITRYDKLDPATNSNIIQERIDVARLEDAAGIGFLSGHNGGDSGLVYALYKELTDDGSFASTIKESYLNHLINFAAEESRLTNTVIDMDEFEKSL